ncbi:MAG: hypothetical protein H6676_02920 [Thermoflexaceae bacterium]|nr:hypothetical protein [Thermoflexaceae bacterium]
MKVAIVTDYYYPALGGITQHTSTDGPRSPEARARVTVIWKHWSPARVVDSAATREDEPPKVIHA